MRDIEHALRIHLDLHSSCVSSGGFLRATSEDGALVQAALMPIDPTTPSTEVFASDPLAYSRAVVAGEVLGVDECLPNGGVVIQHMRDGVTWSSLLAPAGGEIVMYGTTSESANDEFRLHLRGLQLDAMTSLSTDWTGVASGPFSRHGTDWLLIEGVPAGVVEGAQVSLVQHGALVGAIDLVVRRPPLDEAIDTVLEQMVRGSDGEPGRSTQSVTTDRSYHTRLTTGPGTLVFAALSRSSAVQVELAIRVALARKRIGRGVMSAAGNAFRTCLRALEIREM